MLSFISRQLNKNISFIKLFPVRGKQNNTSSNDFVTQTSAKNFFDHKHNAKAH